MSYQINKFAKTGILLGSIAFAISMIHFLAGPFSTSDSEFNIDHVLVMGSQVLAMMAIVSAAVSFFKNENIRLSSIAATLGGVTLAFRFILAAIGIVIFLAAIVFIVSKSRKHQ